LFWIGRTGSPWRDLPEEFGKWSPVYRQFWRWTLTGLWERLLGAPNNSGLLPEALQMTDIKPVSATGSSEPARVFRAHHQTAGAKRGLSHCAPLVQAQWRRRQGLGRSRGGFTTKIHLRVNTAGLPMRSDITPGQTSNYQGFDLVMDDNLPKP
jgi:transposase